MNGRTDGPHAERRPSARTSPISLYLPGEKPSLVLGYQVPSIGVPRTKYSGTNMYDFAMAMALRIEITTQHAESLSQHQDSMCRGRSRCQWFALHLNHAYQTEIGTMRQSTFFFVCKK